MNDLKKANPANKESKPSRRRAEGKESSDEDEDEL